MSDRPTALHTAAVSLGVACASTPQRHAAPRVNKGQDNTERSDVSACGFLKGRNTMLQLIKIIDMWTDMLEEGGQMDVIYADLGI